MYFIFLLAFCAGTECFMLCRNTRKDLSEEKLHENDKDMNFERQYFQKFRTSKIVSQGTILIVIIILKTCQFSHKFKYYACQLK